MYLRDSLRTLATENDRQVPELSHVESLEDLTLVGSTVSVEGQGNVLLIGVLACEGDTSTNGDLSTNDTVSTVEAGGEHVHGSTLSVGDTLSPAEQFTDDGLDGRAAHQSEAVATVGGDEMVGAFNGVFDTDGDGLLTGGQMAKTPNLLLLVQPVSGHFHASISRVRMPSHVEILEFRDSIPDSDHVVVHLLQLLLGDVHGVWRRVEFICLECLVREADLKGLVVLLRAVSNPLRTCNPRIGRRGEFLTEGTLAGSVWDEAASVVTDLKAGRATGMMALRLKGEAMLRLIVLDSILEGEQDGRGVKSGLTAVVVLIRKVAQLRQLGDPLSR